MMTKHETTDVVVTYKYKLTMAVPSAQVAHMLAPLAFSTRCAAPA